MTKMNKRKYIKFPTQLNLPSDVTCEGFYDDWEGVRILLRDNDENSLNAVLRVNFGQRVIAYKCVDEGIYPVSWNMNPLWICIVKNSDYITQVCEQSDGILDKKDLIHFAIYTPHDCFDIIDIEYPKIEFL